MSDRPYSVAQLAERWGFDDSHIYRMIKRGEIATFRFGGRAIRIAAAEVDRWENTGLTPSVNTGSEPSEPTPSPSGSSKGAAAAFASARR